MEREVIDLTNSPPSSPQKPYKPSKILKFTAYISSRKIRFKVKKSCLPSWNFNSNPNPSYLETITSPHGNELREPWTPKEHEQFLMGLMKYGGGRWNKIAKNFAKNKTPQQVESHATSFFINFLETYLSPTAAITSSNNDLIAALASALISNPKMKKEDRALPRTLTLFSDGETSTSTGNYEMNTRTCFDDHGDVDLELRLG